MGPLPFLGIREPLQKQPEPNYGKTIAKPWLTQDKFNQEKTSTLSLEGDLLI